MGRALSSSGGGSADRNNLQAIVFPISFAVVTNPYKHLEIENTAVPCVSTKYVYVGTQHVYVGWQC